MFSTRSDVTGLSKHAEPASAFVQPYGTASAAAGETGAMTADRDHPRALDTSQTLEFARISEVPCAHAIVAAHTRTYRDHDMIHHTNLTLRTMMRAHHMCVYICIHTHTHTRTNSY